MSPRGPEVVEVLDDAVCSDGGVVAVSIGPGLPIGLAVAVAYGAVVAFWSVACADAAVGASMHPRPTNAATKTKWFHGVVCPGR